MTRRDVVRGMGPLKWSYGSSGLGIAFPRVIGSVDIQIRHVL
jgi:hypothetical protein